MRAAVPRPAHTVDHRVATSTPAGVFTPMPVTTTRGRPFESTTFTLMLSPWGIRYSPGYPVRYPARSRSCLLHRAFATRRDTRLSDAHAFAATLAMTRSTAWPTVPT